MFKSFDKKYDLILFIRDWLREISLYLLVCEQKNIKNNDYTNYVTDIRELNTKSFVTEVTEWFIKNIPVKDWQEFRRFLGWQEGKAIFKDCLYDLNLNKVFLHDRVADPQGMIKTNIFNQPFNADKFGFLSKSIIIKFGRQDTNRFIYFVLKGNLKRHKYIGVVSGARHPGSTALQDSLKAG